jgi:methylated-DNA-protein-cysteine methyltransferase-like protein
MKATTKELRRRPFGEKEEPCVFSSLAPRETKKPSPATVSSERKGRFLHFFSDVYRLVARVPRGKVVTYGQVAALLGFPHAARAVGAALRHLPPALARTVPWQRVINASGGISLRGDVLRVEEQRWLLEYEGVAFTRQGKVDLKKYRWAGPARKPNAGRDPALPSAKRGGLRTALASLRNQHQLAH